jgi:hypothetical protein
VCAYEVARRGKTLYLTCYFAWYAPPRMRIFASRHLVCVDNYGVHRRQWRTRSLSSASTNVKPGAAGCESLDAGPGTPGTPWTWRSKSATPSAEIRPRRFPLLLTACSNVDERVPGDG